MDPSYKIAELKRNQAVFKELLQGIPETEYHWRWQPEKWNLLEIVCHLHDEEREDFRERTQSVLEDPAKELRKIDPPGWVLERNYMEQNYDAMLDKFLQERENSVKWLKSLKAAKWDNAFVHPSRGPLTAAFFLSNWVAHDYLHIRQILNLKYQYLQKTTGDMLDYAGNW
jgi:hypothetical protein